MAPSRTVDRLRRLLAIVPYVVRHPGTGMEELSRLFGVDEPELIDDLNLLFMTGLPPYSPGDLVDMEIEEGRVWISMADHFSQPVRLTRDEALALYLKGTEVLGAPGHPEAEALRSALDKLEGALGPETLGELRAEVGTPGGDPGPVQVLRRAAAERERLEIEYYAASRDEVTTRRIDPEHVFSAIGNWYVVAWDHRSEDERLFRLDRIREVRGTGERFEPRGLMGPGRELYSPSAQDIRVRLRLGPGARWVAEYYQTERIIERGSRAEVVLPTKDLAWVARLVLQLGGQVEIVDPPELRDMVREVAGQTLERYRKTP